MLKGLISAHHLAQCKEIFGNKGYDSLSTLAFHIRDLNGTVAHCFFFIFFFANLFYFTKGLLAVSLIIGCSVLLRVAKRIQIIVTLV